MAMFLNSNSMFVGKRFLIVDDFQGMRGMLREMLKSFGAKDIDMAANGKEAIVCLEKNKYSAVLCDYNLGIGKNGQQVLEEAKCRDLIGLATAWIIISAEKTSDMVVGAAEYMPDDYIIKPVTEAALRSRVEKVMTKKVALHDIEKAISTKNFARAIALCDEALSASKANATDLLRIKTNLLLNMGNYDQARQVFEKILAVRDVPWARTGLAKVAFYSNDAATAQRLLQELLKENPAYLEAHDLLAKIYESQGNLEEAQRVLARSTALSPNSYIRQRSFGEIAHKRGDLEAAEHAYRKSIKLGEFSVLKTPVAHLGLAKLCSAKDNPVEALQILKSVGKEFNDQETNFHAKVVEGMVHRKSGDYVAAGKAAKEIAEIVQRDKNSLPAGTMIEAAQLLLETGNKEVAESLVQNIVKNNHENKELIAQVNEVYSQAGMVDEGQKLVETARKEVVDANNRGVTLAKEGKLDEAIEWLRNARNMLPNNKRILINLANVAVLSMNKNGRNDTSVQEVRECVEKVAKLDPDEKWCAQIQNALDALPKSK
ncbi:MAG: tetratricopeptide repeat protein [Sulfuricellaceae bacterium]